MPINFKWRSPMVAAFALSLVAAPALSSSQLDSTRSRVIVEVGKAGAFSFAAGHSHRIEAPIRGTLTVDPAHPENAAARFEIRTADLRVMPDGEPPEDVPKVQATMASDRVLDVSRYPQVTFQSRAVRVRERRGNALELSITGDLTLHGTTRSIIVPVHAELAPGTAIARGTFTVKQTDYGMQPVSVAGGMVSVKDELKIQFTIVQATTAPSN